MRILAAFDKFKEALTAPEACEAAAAVLRQKFPAAEIDVCPLTDGGDGFGSILTQAARGDRRQISVTGPLQAQVSAGFGLIRGSDVPAAALSRLGFEGKKRIGIVEMAEASGLALVSAARRNPWQTTSAGTGELLRAATAAEADCLLLGIGGSATNDLGLGALAALGWRFEAADGSAVPLPLPSKFSAIARMIPPNDQGRLSLRIACDVSNPLLGANGATAIYGPQKGLRPEDYSRLEAAMARMATLLCETTRRPTSLMEIPGAGAAGGIGFGLMAALDAKLTPGSTLIADWLDLDRRVNAADLILTGEGRFDASTLSGKGPGALIARAAAQAKPVHIFAGRLQPPPTMPPNVFLHAITPPQIPHAEALARCREFLVANLTEFF